MKNNNYIQPTIEILEFDIQSDIMTASGIVEPPFSNPEQQTLKTEGVIVEETNYDMFQ